MQHPWKTNANQRKLFVSYSGGKDSTLALYHAMQVGEVLGLLVMLEEHGCWHDTVTAKAGLKLSMPLWQRPHREVIDEFIELGFSTIIVTVNLDLGMKVEDLGKILTHTYIQELQLRGIDPCGEGGEFHTTVIDGPIFKHAIAVHKGAILHHENYAFLPLKLEK